MFPKSLNFEKPIQEIENEDDWLYNGTSFLYDFQEGDFIYKDGNPIVVRGKEAIKIWVEKALRTRIYTYDAYDNRDEEGLLTQREYGSNIRQLTLGRKLPRLLIQAETKRDIEETLLKNNRIKEIINYEIEQGNVNNSVELLIRFDVVLVNDDKIDMGVEF